MNNILKLCLILLCTHYCRGQSIERQVIGSSGMLTNTGTIQGSSTVGESVINTHAQATLIITQGFQQPDTLSTVGISTLDNSMLDINVYPNPATDEVIINFISSPRAAIGITIYNQAGQIMHNQLPIKIQDNYKQELNFKKFASGNYFIIIKSADNKIHKEFKVQKIN